MRPQSAKAKGRRLQQWVRDKLVECLNIHPEDIESRSMGAGGEDLIMARAARIKFPHSIECKNVEKLNIWDAYEQASANCGDYEQAKLRWPRFWSINLELTTLTFYKSTPAETTV